MWFVAIFATALLLRLLISRRDTALDHSPEPVFRTRYGVRVIAPPDDLTWLDPPSDVHDATAWDEYWKTQVAHGDLGMIGVTVADEMASDPALLGLIEHLGLHDVLCIGNGLSQEAAVLAHAGLNVTALDLSGEATRLAPREPRSVMHGRASVLPSPGRLTFVSGDFTDPTACPGPFDVIIERRTVQLFDPEERAIALRRLAERLRVPGLLVSQQHMGGWRPGQSRTHFASDWLRQDGFSICTQPEDAQAIVDVAPRRVACLLVTSG